MINNVFCICFVTPMTVHEFFDEMKSIQINILNYIGNEHGLKENDENFLLDYHIIKEDHQKLKLFLNLISNIANNHHNQPNSANKIGEKSRFNNIRSNIIFTINNKKFS